jgi:hypothetical protein
LAEMDAWLAPYRRLWSERLDALGRHLDAMPDDLDDPHEPDDPEHPDHVRTEKDDQ